jgi:hypothetical protein
MGRGGIEKERNEPPDGSGPSGGPNPLNAPASGGVRTARTRYEPAANAGAAGGGRDGLTSRSCC